MTYRNCLGFTYSSSAIPFAISARPITLTTAKCDHTFAVVSYPCASVLFRRELTYFLVSLTAGRMFESMAPPRNAGADSWSRKRFP